MAVPLVGEGAGDRGDAPLVAVEVGVEDDVLALGSLEALLGLEGQTQGVGVNHLAGGQIVGQVGVQMVDAVLLLQLQGDVVLGVHNGIGVDVGGLGTVEVYVAAHPHRQGHIVPVPVHAAALAAVALEAALPLLLGHVAGVGQGAADQVVVVPLHGVAGLRLADFLQLLPHRLLDEDVVIEAHVAVENGHKAGNFRPVGQVNGGVAGGVVLLGAVLHALAHGGDRAGNQVVDEGHALGGQLNGPLGEHDVVVHQAGAVGNLDEDVLAQTQAHGVLPLEQIVPGHTVVVEQVGADPGALGLPVQPDTPDAVVEMVVADDYVDGGVELDAADFGTGQIPLVVDVVDVVVLNHGEHAAQVAHDAGLAAVVDVAAPDGVGADGLLAPAVDLGDEGAVPLGLGAVLVLIVEPLVVVALLQILAQGDAGALGVGDLAVLNHPALGPVGADHAVLQGGGGCPLGGGLGHHKACQGDVVHMLLLRVEAVGADGDFHVLFVGVLALEVGINQGALPVLALGGVPGVLGECNVPGGIVLHRLKHLLQGVLLVQ